MILTLDGHSVHAATGGPLPAGPDDRPVLLLIHGAGMDATVWQLQTRWLAHHGVRAVAVDLPGHGRSGGAPLGSVVAMADWTARFLEAAALAPAHVAGHSMGTFVGLELARRRPELVRSLVLCGTAEAMGVHPDLLAGADHDLATAAALMASWGHAAPAHVGPHPAPGQWMLGGARALVEQSRPGALAADFAACAAYTDAPVAAAAVTCPVAVAIGVGDKMTPARSARRLIEVLPDPEVLELPGVGHMMMTEAAAALRSLLLRRVAPAVG